MRPEGCGVDIAGLGLRTHNVKIRVCVCVHFIRQRKKAASGKFQSRGKDRVKERQVNAFLCQE